jgi:hypothetical protein
MTIFPVGGQSRPRKFQPQTRRITIMGKSRKPEVIADDTGECDAALVSISDLVKKFVTDVGEKLKSCEAMPAHLTKAQIDQLRVILAQVGLDMRPMPKPRSKSEASHLARIRAWKPETPAGSKCKSRMLAFAKLPPVIGVSDYKVKGDDGQWHGDASQGFEAAKAYQNKRWANYTPKANEMI